MTHGRCWRSVSCMASRLRSSLRSPRPTLRALARRDEALGSVGSRPQTTSVRLQPLAGGFVLYFTASYSVTYLLVGALGVLTLLVVLLLPDADRPASDTKTLSARTTEFRQGLAEVLRTPPIFVAAGIEAAMYLGYGAFLGFLPIYAKNVGLKDAEIALVLGAQLVLAMVAKPITGRVSDRVGRIPDIIVGLLLF